MDRRGNEGHKDLPQLRRVVEVAGDRWEGQEAAAVLRWARATFGTRLCATASMTDATVAHLLSVHAPGTDVLFLDTGQHFPETLDFRRQVEQSYELHVVDVHWDSPSGWLKAAGPAVPNEFDVDPDSCCRRRKILPLREALASYDAWITGVRRAETASRAATPMVSWDESNQVVKIAPIAAWSDDQVAAYADDFNLPRHPLTRIGYTSIGCAPCTSLPVTDDPRSGRWRGRSKVECGLHPQ